MLLATLLLIATVGQDVSELTFRRAIADNATYHRERFIEAGLMPIEEAAKKGRNVRRLLVSVWIPGRPPVMEIERQSDGSVTLLLTWQDKPSERHPLDASVWKDLMALDKAVFATPKYDLNQIGKPPEGVYGCHGDTAAFEASIDGRVQTAAASQCLPRMESFDDAKRSVIALFSKVAITTQPGCTTDDARPAEALIHCFR